MKRNAPNMVSYHKRSLVRTEVSSKREPYGKITATVRDKNGNIIQTQSQNVDSLLTNFWRNMYRIHDGSNQVTLTRLDGLSNSNLVRNRNTDGGLESFAGIVVGTSSTAVAYADVQMGALITHGVGSGQLSAEETSNYYNPTTDTVEIVRTFVNADTNAATITVAECGLTSAEIGGTVSTSFAVLYCRDVLGTALDVPYDGVLTVIYSINFFNGNANFQRLLNRNSYRDRATTQTYENVVATNGTGLTFTAQNNFDILGSVGYDTEGIVLGTGNASPTTKSTWNLEGKIAHGEGVGQLFYYESTISSLEEDTTNNACRWYLNRVVQNRSGGTITVNEIALFSNVQTGASTYVPFMVDRKFPDEGGVPITNSAFATFSWEICYEL